MTANIQVGRPLKSLQRNRFIDPQAMPSLIRPDEWVFVPGSSGAPLAFMEQLLHDPEFTRNARLLTSYVPGINALDLAGMHPTGQVTGLFMQPELAVAQREGRFRALPISYAGFVRHITEQVDIDLAVIQLSPPDENGMCSLGPSVEFTPAVLRKARRRLGLINLQTPIVRGSYTVPFNSLDYVCEVDTPLPIYDVPSDSGTEAIARHIAPLIEDGAVLQTGLGKVPTALMSMLRSRRGLKLHSGMLSDGLLELAAAGALDMNYLHTSCVLVGSRAFYEKIRDFHPLRVVGCDISHDPVLLAKLDHFVTVNSALEVDLFGQCNLEMTRGAAISGCGGAPDFARAGRLSRGGCSIIALHATHRRGSRIVPMLGPQTVTTLSRVDVDFVVTEYGVARLKGASVHERAEALIQVAAPEYRSDLQDAWRAIANRL
ncbi:acetyl-CoA hydrolase/transferase C-terminal domain-containing protein [Pseudomonas sp. SB113]|uniref:acetyl-CoA hydrolase/transferase family protein n=1 Tax=Pseudomonas sp. SB113 TaxID=3154123 RepID=UPI00345D9442